MLQKDYHKLISWFCLAACLIVISGCSSTPIRLQNLAKSDVNMVGDSHIQQANELLKSLLTKLYKRNPRELKKNNWHSIESRATQIFSNPLLLNFDELQQKQSIDAILLSFDENFQGDRVFALMVGLRGMLYKAYSEKNELFMLDQLDAQKLYNSARNIEIVAWRLSQTLDPQGQPVLLTNSIEPPVNLSFERLLGKLIALQDMMAKITADRSNRTINKIVHSIASAVFLPVG